MWERSHAVNVTVTSPVTYVNVLLVTTPPRGIVARTDRAQLAELGRRVNVNDLGIAATVAAHDLPVVTQDDDFAPLEGVHGVEVIRV